MIKIVVGMFLITFDYVVSPDGRIKLDLLPDFIGYAIIGYAFFRIYQNASRAAERNNAGKGQSNQHKNSNNAKGRKARGLSEINRKNAETALKNAVKNGIIVSIIMVVVSYISCMMDMYGMISDMNAIVPIVVSAVTDMGMIFTIYLFVQLLSALQGQNNNFQIKRMMMLWKVMIVCIVCEYISLSADMVTMTFIIFEKIVEVIFMVYVFTSDRTYKSKFYVKK